MKFKTKEFTVLFGLCFSLEEDIFQYAKHNLAVVNVYIKDPVVTRILRDQKIPIIAFVANTGGLLGLCMGFSLVSVFEIIYHILGAFRNEENISQGQSPAAFKNHNGATRQNSITTQIPNGTLPAQNNGKFSLLNCFELEFTFCLLKKLSHCATFLMNITQSYCETVFNTIFTPITRLFGVF